MTKRIIALVLVAIMAAVALVACAEDPATTPTTAPADTTAAPETTGNATSAPTTTPATDNSGDDETPTDVPTETDDPLPDPFKKFGGLDVQWMSGNVYGNGFECWPFLGNDTYCPRAFWQFTLVLSTEEADFIENVNNPADYKYTWHLYWKDSEADIFDDTNWHGPYQVYLETFYAYGGDNPNVIYRLQTSDSPEGDPCASFELGKQYDLIFQVFEGDENKGFTMVTFNWGARVDAEYKVYNGFWKDRNRDAGYAAADQTATDADHAFAESLGFTIGENNSVEFTDPNAQ